MKKVLMISCGYYYPPIGILRTAKFCKYLPNFGWTPVMLTTQVGTSKIDNHIREDLKNVRVYSTQYFDIDDFVKKMLFISPRRGIPLTDTGYITEKGRLFAFATRVYEDYIDFPDRCIGWLKNGVKKGIKIIEKEQIDLIYSTSP